MNWQREGQPFAVRQRLSETYIVVLLLLKSLSLAILEEHLKRSGLVRLALVYHSADDFRQPVGQIGKNLRRI